MIHEKLAIHEKLERKMSLIVFYASFNHYFMKMALQFFFSILHSRRLVRRKQQHRAHFLFVTQIQNDVELVLKPLKVMPDAVFK